MPTLEETYLTAAAKRAEGRGLKNSEIFALTHFERIKTRPVGGNYQPLGVTPNQLLDRVHTVQEAGSRGGAAGGTIYTFTACVSGAPKSFDIRIMRGPY